MKKIITILMILFLCGCGKTKENELKIVSPKGAPVLAFYDQINNKNYLRVAANTIGALWLGENSPDIIVCDVLSGYKAINDGADYSLASIITSGNFYLAATGRDEDKTMNKGDVIVLFGNENQIPSRVFHFLFGDEFDQELIYEADAQTASLDLATSQTLAGNKVDYVFVAQPSLYVAMQKNKDAYIYCDIQKDYYEKTGLKIVQAAVFVKNKSEKTMIDNFLKELRSSIEKGLDNPDLISEGLSVYKDEEALTEYGFNPTIIMKVFSINNWFGTNSIGLCYVDAVDMKEDIDYFLNLFGMDDTKNEKYYQ